MYAIHSPIGGSSQCSPVFLCAIFIVKEYVIISRDHEVHSSFMRGFIMRVNNFIRQLVMMSVNSLLGGLLLLSAMVAAQAQTCALGGNSAASGNSFQLESYNSTVSVSVGSASSFLPGGSFILQNVNGVARAFASANYLRATGNTSVTYTFSSPVPANRVALVVFDIGVGTSIPSPYSPLLTLSVTGGAGSSDFGFSSMLDGASNSPLNPLTYTSSSGVISKTSTTPTVRESGALVGNSNNLVSSLTLTTSGINVGDLVGYGLASIPTCITTRKLSVGAVGSFSFENKNLSVPTSVLTTTAINSPVDGPMAFVSNPIVPITIAETLPSSPSGWRQAKASCTDANRAITGNAGEFGTLSGNTLAIPSSFLHPAANITCLFTNSLLVAVDDTQSTAMDVPVNGGASIFANDTGTGIALSDLNGSACNFFPCIRNLANGTITVNVAGEYTFSPAPGFTGVVTIPYQIKDVEGLAAVANIIINVNPVPKLRLAKSSNGPWGVQQSGATYTLSVINAGSAPTFGDITVRDSLPAGISANNLDSGSWSCTVSGQDVTCISPASIAAGGVSTINLPVSVGESAALRVTNNASVGGGGDPNNGGAPPVPGSCSEGDSHCATDITNVNQASSKPVPVDTPLALVITAILLWVFSLRSLKAKRH
ncbi:Ig-like domain-containing protein [Comamonas testosteroni]